MTFIDKIKELFQSVKDIFANFAPIGDSGLFSEGGKVEVGTAVMVKSGDQYNIAPDGEYKDGDTTYVVVDSIVTEIQLPEPEEPEEEPLEETPAPVTRQEYEDLVARVAALEERLSPEPAPIDESSDDEFKKIDRIFDKFRKK